MTILGKIFGSSPFGLLVEHTKKVHECVLLVRPIAEALVTGDRDKLEVLHNTMSQTEHEADQIKDRIRNELINVHLLSVGKYELTEFLAVQDSIADATEDFSVVAVLRDTKIHPDLHEDFKAFVDQVIQVSEKLLALAEELALLAEAAFTGKEAERVLAAIDRIGQEEWKADRLQRRFARHCYQLEDQLDPTTLAFYDKYCITLSTIANKAEKTAKFLRLIIAKR